MYSNSFRLVTPTRFSLFAVSFLFVVIWGPANAKSSHVSLESSSWVVLAYNKIPPNKVDFIDRKLVIKVAQSAGPIVHRFKSPEKVSGISIKGNFQGKKRVELREFDEDSILRFGIVGLGTQTLTGFKKLLAADWVKKLFALAPEGTGLDKIYFYNMTNRKELLGMSRSHPKSELIFESMAQFHDKEGPFEMQLNLEKPIEAAAIWMSVDGDDTQSEFTTTVSGIEIKQPTN